MRSQVPREHPEERSAASTAGNAVRGILATHIGDNGTKENKHNIMLIMRDIIRLYGAKEISPNNQDNILKIRAKKWQLIIV